MAQMSRTSVQGGFTLIELMVTIAVLAITLAIAVPSFKATMESNRIRAATAELVTSLNMARTHAVDHRVAITLAPQSGTDWSSGWRLTFPTGSTQPEEQFTVPAEVAVSLKQGASTLVYSSRGIVSGGERVFTVCRSAGGGSGRQITVTPFGQVRNVVINCS